MSVRWRGREKTLNTQYKSLEDKSTFINSNEQN